MSSEFYSNHPTTDDIIRGADLSGKRAIITGGSSGLGLETARALLKAGASVVLPVRNQDKGAAAREELLQKVPGADVSLDSMDLTDYDTVRRFADSQLAQDQPLDLLINNAGVMACPERHTDRGHEWQFTANHLGHFVLATALAPLLRKAAPSRVVVLSSLGHRLSPVHLDDPNFQQRPYDKWLAYGQAKSANALFAREFNRRFSPDIEAFAVHPGGVLTGLTRDLSIEELQQLGWFDQDGNPKPVFKTTAQGAATTLWAAIDPALSGHGGAYLENCGFSRPREETNPFAGYSSHITRDEDAAALWRLSEKMTS